VNDPAHRRYIQAGLTALPKPMPKYYSLSLYLFS